MASNEAHSHPAASRADSLASHSTWLNYVTSTLMVLVGAVWGAVALAISMVVTYDSGATWFETFVVFSVLTIGPAAVLWLTRSRPSRAFAAGMACIWGVVVFAVFVWNPWDTMSAQEIERAKAEVLASCIPALYLGDDVAGHDLNSYYLGGDQANFFYGKCHPSSDDAEGGCSSWDISVHNAWGDATLVGDAVNACTRLEPILGVPAVQLRDELLELDEIVLFTGNTKVRVEFVATTEGEERVAVLRNLRPVSTGHATTRLPPPNPRLLAVLEHDCGSPQP